MPTSMIIVDDFLGPADAKGLREAALGLTYPEQQGAFPGRNSVERMEIGGLTEAVSRPVGEPLRPMPPTAPHAKLRATLAGDVGRAKVHVGSSHGRGRPYLTRLAAWPGGPGYSPTTHPNTKRA